MTRVEWESLSSDERLDEVLLAVAEIADESPQRVTSAGAIANRLGLRFSFRPASGNHGTGNVARRMSDAVKVTPALMGLRKRGLTKAWSRQDDLSGTAEYLTDAGVERVRVLRAEREESP